MCEEWKPIWVNTIDLCDDDDVPPASPAVGSSSQDATRQKRSRPRTDILGMGNNRWGHHDDSGKGKGKGKGKRDASPPAKGGKAGASSKRARKSAASDAALDMDMEKYEEKRVAELKKTYEGLINEHNHQRIANLELIGDAASAGERLVSSHSPVLHPTDISIQQPRKPRRHTSTSRSTRLSTRGSRTRSTSLKSKLRRASAARSTSSNFNSTSSGRSSRRPNRPAALLPRCVTFRISSSWSNGRSRCAVTLPLSRRRSTRSASRSSTSRRRRMCA